MKTKLIHFGFFIAFMGLFRGHNLNAFPEMIRHGYVNCMSCHATPSGGGALTPYGRAMVKEILSTWSTKNEHEILHGALPVNRLPSWLYTLGGDIRGLQYHIENDYIKEGDWMWMQMELEAGIKLSSLRMNASVAKFEKDGKDEFVLRNAYGQIPLGSEQSLKIGLFKSHYGINMANHSTFVKEDLGLGARSESYNLEYHWISKNVNYVASASLPHQENKKEIDERRHLQQLSFNFAKSYKLGANYMHINSNQGTQDLYGVFGLLGFSKSLYSLVEFDLVKQNPVSGRETNGYASFTKLAYEFFQGFHMGGSAEFYQSRFDQDKTRKSSYGLVLQWFPRPHFEFQVAWNKVQNRAVGDDWTDAAYFLFHYYL